MRGLSYLCLLACFSLQETSWGSQSFLDDMPDGPGHHHWLLAQASPEDISTLITRLETSLSNASALDAETDYYASLALCDHFFAQSLEGGDEAPVALIKWIEYFGRAERALARLSQQRA